MKLNPNGETTNNPTSLSEAVITREDSRGETEMERGRLRNINKTEWTIASQQFSHPVSSTASDKNAVVGSLETCRCITIHEAQHTLSDLVAFHMHVRCVVGW